MCIKHRLGYILIAELIYLYSTINGKEGDKVVTV